MYLRKANKDDALWLFDILEELRHPVKYTQKQFNNYFETVLLSDYFQFLIFYNDSDKLGMVSLNKFYMPRYIGVGYEMEEFVIHKNFRGKGLSYKMIEEVKNLVNKDLQSRKLIIKSNGEDSKHIYSKALKETDLVTYQTYFHKL